MFLPKFTNHGFRYVASVYYLNSIDILAKSAELLGNDLFLTFAAQKTIKEISAMLPPEAMKLIELVLAQCNAAEEGGEV